MNVKCIITILMSFYLFTSVTEHNRTENAGMRINLRSSDILRGGVAVEFIANLVISGQTALPPEPQHYAQLYGLISAGLPLPERRACAEHRASWCNGGFILCANVAQKLKWSPRAIARGYFRKIVEEGRNCVTLDETTQKCMHLICCGQSELNLKADLEISFCLILKRLILFTAHIRLITVITPHL